MEISSKDQKQNNINEIKSDEEEDVAIINENEDNENEAEYQSMMKEGDEQTQNIEELQKINFPENTNNNRNMQISNNNNNFITFGDINNSNSNKYIKKNTLNNKNDILSNILDKIKSFKENHNKNNKSKINENIKNNTLETLNKEIALGLEKLTLNNNKQKKIENQINTNPKLKEIMYIINGETIINESPTKRKILRDFDYGINGVDDVYKYFNSKHNFKKRVKKGSLYNRYYISCIDGKAIINGTRRDISNKNLYNTNFDFLNFRDKNYNGVFSTRRNKSINFNKFFNDDNHINKTAKFQKNNYLLNFDFDTKYNLKHNINSNIRKLNKLENDYLTKLNKLKK